MKPGNGSISDAELHAYVDNQLDPGRRRQVQRHLAEHPEEALRVLDYQTFNQQLHSLFDNVLDEPVPKHLRRLAGRSARFWLQAAALVGVLVLGGVSGWLLHGQLQPASVQVVQAEPLVDQALLAHTVYTREKRHAVEVAAAEEQHLVAWLSKRLGKDIRVPHLGGLGFELLGGRLLASNDGPAAHFMYQNEAGQRLTLFVLRKTDVDAATAFQFASKGDINTFYWIDGELGYALSGELDKTRLSEIAREVERQLAQ